MDLVILVMAIKGKEMNKDVVMELDQSFGLMNQVMKASGIRAIVMEMESTDKKQARNIAGNGSLMFVMEKVNGLMKTEESSLETSEMIHVTVYVLINLLQAKKVN
jgi:hypothetical protein